MVCLKKLPETKVKSKNKQSTNLGTIFVKLSLPTRFSSCP